MLGFVLGDRFEIAGVGHNGRAAFHGIKNVHWFLLKDFSLGSK
jgi:hypothetical protein